MSRDSTAAVIQLATDGVPTGFNVASNGRSRRRARRNLRHAEQLDLHENKLLMSFSSWPMPDYCGRARPFEHSFRTVLGLPDIRPRLLGVR